MHGPGSTLATTTDPSASEPVPNAEMEAERAARLARERALLAEAREDARTGRVIADEDVDVWLDLVVGGEPLPKPGIPSGCDANQAHPAMARPRRLTIARAAAQDLADARRWLTQPGAGARATQRLATLCAAVRGLRLRPCRWPAEEHPGLRDRRVESCRVVHQIAPHHQRRRDVGGSDRPASLRTGPGPNRPSGPMGSRGAEDVGGLSDDHPRAGFRYSAAGFSTPRRT